MYWIYCYTNKINNHKYVGQTNNLQRRKREHASNPFNPNSQQYNTLFYKKIREYGIDNFNFSILEKIYTDDLDLVNKKEQYWIEKEKSYIVYGQGYNLTIGGDNRSKIHLFLENEIELLRQKIKNGIPYSQLQKEYNVSNSFLSSVNFGEYYFSEKEEYPLCRHYREKEKYNELINLLQNSKLSLQAIAKKTDLNFGTIQKINNGSLRKDLWNSSYPIRKISPYEDRANKIKNLLMTTDLSNIEIGKIVGASEETVRRIKVGISFKDNSLKYPLKKICNDYPELD